MGTMFRTAQSVLTIILKLTMQWSGQHHLAYFNEFVLISLRPVPGILPATGLVLLRMES